MAPPQRHVESPARTQSVYICIKPKGPAREAPEDAATHTTGWHKRVVARIVTDGGLEGAHEGILFTRKIIRVMGRIDIDVLVGIGHIGNLGILERVAEGDTVGSRQRLAERHGRACPLEIVIAVIQIGPVEIHSQRELAVEEPGLDQGDLVVTPFRPELGPQIEFLAATGKAGPTADVEVALRYLNKPDDVVDAREAGTHHELAGPLLLDLVDDIFTVGNRRLEFVAAYVREIAQVHKAALTAPRLDGIQHIARVDLQLAANHLIARTRIAANTDIAHSNQVTLAHRQYHRNRSGIRVGFKQRPYTGARIPAAAIEVADTPNRVFDLRRRSDLATAGRHKPLSLDLGEEGHALNRHRAKAIGLAFADGDHDGLAPLLIQLHRGVVDPDIQKAALAIDRAHGQAHRLHFVTRIAPLAEQPERIPCRRALNSTPQVTETDMRIAFEPDRLDLGASPGLDVHQHTGQALRMVGRFDLPRDDNIGEVIGPKLIAEGQHADPQHVVIDTIAHLEIEQGAQLARRQMVRSGKEDRDGEG